MRNMSIVQTYSQLLFHSTIQTISSFFLDSQWCLGASRINNITGSRWFVTFVDDHTRVTWVFLMKKKSEVREIFENFNNMVQTQFQEKIQVLRTDNARQHSWVISFGEWHHTSKLVHWYSTAKWSCRKENRHLMEVARSLMIASNVPKQLWGEVVLTTTYLISRMPSRILQFKTSCQILLAAYSSTWIISSILVKVFGCTSFVHIHKSQRSKLDPIATKCIFLGYSPNQKGYSATLQQPRNSTLPWMSLSSKINPSTPKLQFRGRTGPQMKLKSALLLLWVHHCLLKQILLFLSPKTIPWMSLLSHLSQLHKAVKR